MAVKLENKNIAALKLGDRNVTKAYLGDKVVFEPTPAFNLGPGPQTLIAGDLNSAGFFGETTQADFGITMTQVMSDFGITDGDPQFTADPLLKFIHNGKIKFINKKTIRYGISWNEISSAINVYGGDTITVGGNSYKVRLMRGWGQVSANPDGTGTPDYENGPLYTISFATGAEGNNGTNWPTNTSSWNAMSPNEWNTLIFPIHEDSQTQDQTDDVPNWASYSNEDLQIATGNARITWTQETVNIQTTNFVARGTLELAGILNGSDAGFVSRGLRLVFELI